MKFPIICGVGAAVVFLALAGCHGSGASDSSVAMVGKDPITEKEFFAYLQRKPIFTAVTPQGQAVSVQLTDPAGYQALKDLIIDKLIFQVAKEQNIYPTDKAVNDELEFQQKQVPTLIQVALGRGLSLDELKNEFRLELAKFNLQTKGQTETTAEATAFIKAHPTAPDFNDPPSALAQVIIAKLADQKHVDSALASGQPFETVAKQYTMDKGAEKLGFRYKYTNELQMPKPIRDLIDKTDEFKTTAWQPMNKQGTVAFKFYIVKKVPTKPKAITPILTEQVRRALLQQKGQKAGIDVNKMIANRIQTMKDSVKINLKPDQTLWADFVTRVTSELAQSTGTGAIGANPAPQGTAPGTGAAPTGAPATTGGVTPGSAPTTSKK